MSRVISGQMRINDLDDAAIRSLYDAAREAGIDTFDHADIYGGAMHTCEARFADALQLTPAERAEITIQTKCGIVPGDRGAMFDFSYEHIIKQAEGSLVALKTDYLDTLLLHRPDALVQPEEVARAFDELASAGKVRAFGVSNHTPRQIELLKTAVAQPLTVNQVQLSLTHAGLIAQPLASNMELLDQSIMRDDSLVDYARLGGITLQAWSPFQAKWFDGVFFDKPEYAELNLALDRIAAKYAVTPITIATAWILRHPANMQVVLGTTNAQRTADAAAAADIELTREEWYDLFRAAGHTVP